jgi:hypothetical protein
MARMGSGPRVPQAWRTPRRPVAVPDLPEPGRWVMVAVLRQFGSGGPARWVPLDGAVVMPEEVPGLVALGLITSAQRRGMNGEFELLIRRVASQGPLAGRGAR